MEVGSAFQIRQKVLIFAHHCAKYRAIFALHINPRQKMHIPPPCGIMIAQCAIRHDSIVPPRFRGDYTLNPRLAEKMPPSAALSPLRAWYNDCAMHNPQTAEKGTLHQGGPHGFIHIYGRKQEGKGSAAGGQAAAGDAGGGGGAAAHHRKG